MTAIAVNLRVLAAAGTAAGAQQVLVLVGLVAALVPARRAARIDPLIALRTA